MDDLPGNHETEVAIGTAVTRGEDDRHYGVVQMKLNELPYGCRPIESKTAGIAMMEASVLANVQATLTRMFSSRGWPDSAIEQFLGHFDQEYLQLREEEEE
jgi:hypothetical protein